MISNLVRTNSHAIGEDGDLRTEVNQDEGLYIQIYLFSFEN